VRLLVTGGAGFIGSAVCRSLARRPGWSILNLDKLTYAASLASLAEVDKLETYRFVEGDICDRVLIDRLLEDFRPEGVMHLAAESHVDRSIEGAGTFVQTNIIGTFTLLEACLAYWDALKGGAKERFRFHHVSTDEVYGSLGGSGHFTETTPYDPRSPYSATKASSDHLVSAWGHTYGLPIVISNCSNNYGPFQFPEKLIPVIILNGLEGRDLPVYGDGMNVRDWLHVVDHVEALRLIVEHGRVGETYNVGGRNERANLHVVHAICDLLDEMAPDPVIGQRRSLIKFVTDRPGHDRRYGIDATKLETELGWRALHPFQRGIRETVRWYLDRRDWWEPIRASRFKGERLGLRSIKTDEASR
jgi:dTDP-glucose 4,6-dehydratase